jgi:hypothetical protein
MQYIQNYIVALSKRDKRLVLLWYALAYRGIEGNKIADSLAKGTIKDKPIEEYTTNLPYSVNPPNPSNPPKLPDLFIPSFIKLKLYS